MLFDPQHLTAPLDATAHVCAYPAEMATTPAPDDDLLLDEDDELELDALLLLDEDDELELDALLLLDEDEELLLDDTSSVVPPLDVVPDHAAVDADLPPVPIAAPPRRPRTLSRRVGCSWRRGPRIRPSRPRNDSRLAGTTHSQSPLVAGRRRGAPPGGG
jgi:hypothetical protein